MNMNPTLKQAKEKIEEIEKSLKALAERLSQSSLQKNQEELLNCAENLRSVKNLIDQAINFTYFGQKTGGQRSTAKKIQAVRENGKKGGRPSKKILIKIEKNQSEETYSVWFNDGSIKVVPGKTLQDVRRNIDLLEFGRSNDKVFKADQLESVFDNKNRNLNHVCTKQNGKFIYTNEQLYEAMGDAKVTI